MTKINFIRECINHRIVNLVFIPTEYNVPDMLTKSLPVYNRHKGKLMQGLGVHKQFGVYDAIELHLP